MFTSDDINEIIKNAGIEAAKDFLEEMNVKPECPDCGGDCGQDGEFFKCRTCEATVYRPQWVEIDN